MYSSFICRFHLKQEYDPKKDVKAEDPIKQLMKKTKFIQSPPIISPPPPVVSTPVKAKGDQDYYPDGGVVSLRCHLNLGSFFSVRDLMSRRLIFTRCQLHI